jgi:hypothetical protein
VRLIRMLGEELGLTVMLVTHDLDTLAALSTKVAVLAEQRILAYGSIDEIMHIDHPFIRNFFLSERSVRALQNSRAKLGPSIGCAEAKSARPPIPPGLPAVLETETMENRSHALAAGIFTLLFGIAAAIAIWWLGQSDASTTTYVLETRRNVTGLNVQAQVRYRGIRAGKVAAIEPDEADPRLILVTISVDNRFRLTRASTATLGYQGVTGLAYVQIEDDGSSVEPLVAKDGVMPRLALKPTLVRYAG